MADHGYESNDDYSFRIKSLLNQDTPYIQCINVVGRSNRRNTAFANALVQALNFKHKQYYDFTEKHPESPLFSPPETPDDNGQVEAPLNPFDRTVAEACALSEGQSTALILDQMHHADFRHHIRLFDFLRCSEWNYPLGQAIANPDYLLLILLSDDPLYHSLQKLSYRIWAEPSGDELILYKPADFSLPNSAAALFEALSLLFKKLSVTPTQSEFKHILNDLENHIYNIKDLQHSLFGWVERIEIKSLELPEVREVLEQIIDANFRYLEIESGEVIELST